MCVHECTFTQGLAVADMVRRGGAPVTVREFERQHHGFFAAVRLALLFFSEWVSE